jgi:hypothetical protein
LKNTTVKQENVSISQNVRFEVFTAVTMKKAVFLDVAPCRCGVNRRFGGTYRLHLQGIRKNKKIRWRRDGENRGRKGGTSLHGKSVEREKGRVWDRSKVSAGIEYFVGGERQG